MDKLIGIDLASGEDHTGIYARIKDAVHVCTLPRELGNVTKLEVRNGKVVAHTESGIEMIVPVR